MHSRSFLLLTVALTTLCAAGCGGKPASVHGVVTYRGEKLTTGNVTFYPLEGGKGMAYGTIGPDGQYKLKSGSQEGVNVGDYKVTVVAQKIPDPTAKNREPKPVPLVPPRFGQVEQSNIVRKVAPGDNVIDLKLID